MQSEYYNNLKDFSFFFNQSLSVHQLTTSQVAIVLGNRNRHFLYLLSTHRNHTFLGKNFLDAGMHTSHLSTGAIKCIPAARVAIWWQAVGGGEDESCQWRPLKRTTHSPVTGEAWWMIISRCDRCCDGGGALAILPFLPPPPLCLSLPLSAYLGQCFNTPLTWLYWHTPDSVWWLMSIWVPLSLSLSLPLSFFLCSSSPCYPLFTVRAVQSGLSHTQSH